MDNTMDTGTGTGTGTDTDTGTDHNDIEQRFRRITGFIEDRLTPLFDPANGSDHGFGMDDTSRALRAARYTVQAASAVSGLVEKRATAPSCGRSWTRPSNTTGTCCGPSPGCGRTTPTS